MAKLNKKGLELTTEELRARYANYRNNLWGKSAYIEQSESKLKNGTPREYFRLLDEWKTYEFELMGFSEQLAMNLETSFKDCTFKEIEDYVFRNYPKPTEVHIRIEFVRGYTDSLLVPCFDH